MSDEELDDPDVFDPVDNALAAIDAALENGRVVEARAALAEAMETLGRDEPSLRLAEAVLTFEERGPAAARPLLEALVRDRPDHAEAWHRLGLLYEELEERDAMIDAFVRTRSLDEVADHEAGFDDPELLRWIEEVAREVLNALPEPFAAKLASVPIALEPRPSEALVRDGFDPRAFGIFEGNQHDEAAPVPTCITIFTHNLLAEFEEEVALEEEIEITILHEVGHFFGLDEDDMERLGLD